MKYFSATRCGPSKSFKPVKNEIASEGYSVQFIDIDQSPNMATQFSVMSVPTVIIEENGIEVDRFVGSIPKQMILERLS